MSKKVELLVEKMIATPYVIEMGKNKVARWFECSPVDVIEARMIARKLLSNTNNDEVKQSPQRAQAINITSSPITGKNVLVIGDTHVPYEKKGYLEFCIEQYNKFNCDTVVHIGDLMDSHATSRHPSVSDAYSPGDELTNSILKLKKWYEAFPNMKVLIGNHDIRVHKISSDNHIASKWLKGYAEVLEVPNWTFEDHYNINGTTYVHGTGTSGVTAAYRRALNAGQNVVMGHLHTDASILYHKLEQKTIWGMIVGCGVDEKSYGMNYAVNAPRKSIISCGIVLDNQPLIVVM